MKLNDNHLYRVSNNIDGVMESLFNLAKWTNGIAFKNIDFSITGIPIIKIAELNNGISKNTAYTDKLYDEKYHIRFGDLLFSWSGNPQTSIDIYKFQLQEGWVNQHIFKVEPYNEKIDYDYFYYLMKLIKPNFIKIASNKQTIGLGHVTLDDIKSINVKIHNKLLQKKIVSILKPLDDKIELNNKINKNLRD